MNGIKTAIITIISQAVPEIQAYAIRKVHKINGRNANFSLCRCYNYTTEKHENMFSELKKKNNVITKVSKLFRKQKIEFFIQIITG